MSVEYLDLVDYLAIAAEVIGLSVGTLIHAAKPDADSTVRAPAAGFGDTGFYPIS